MYRTGNVFSSFKTPFLTFDFFYSTMSDGEIASSDEGEVLSENETPVKKHQQHLGGYDMFGGQKPQQQNFSVSIKSKIYFKQKQV